MLQVLNRRGGDRFTDEDERAADAPSRRRWRTALQSDQPLPGARSARKEQPQAPVGYFFNRIIGESPADAGRSTRLVQKAAPTDATVLLRGESGCGKELFARAIHVNSAAARQAVREGGLRGAARRR